MVNAVRLLLEVQPASVGAMPGPHGPLILKRQTFPGDVLSVLEFEEDYTVVVVDTNDIVPMEAYWHFEGVSAIEMDQMTEETQWFQWPLMNPSPSFNRSDDVCIDKAPWHLARITHEEWDDKTNKTLFKMNGKVRVDNVDVYIVDSGIDTKHSDFARGQVKQFFRKADGATGHGTHVAGLVGSQAYGVAKGVSLLNVHVLGSDGRAPYSVILEGLSEISRKRDPERQCVINMSINGPHSPIVSRVVEGMMRGGCHVVVAAGNNAIDACYTSPASANVITVAASNIKDEHASFSNHGPCVTLYAPGDAIQSTWPGNKTAFMAGTSMAAPIVAGLVALKISQEPWLHPYNVKRALVADAQKQQLTKVPDETLNALAYLPNKAVCSKA